MAQYPNSPWYSGQRTPGVVVEFTTGDPSTSSALAGIPVSATNPFPVTIISGGGGGGGAVNLTQVGGASINIGADPSAVGAASLPVVFPTGYSLPITGSVTATLGSLVAGSAIIGKVGIDQTAGQNVVVLAAGSAIAGKVGIDQTAGQNLVQIIPATTGGLTKARILVPNSTTGTSVVTGARQLYHWSGFNVSSVPAYAKLYDKASAPVVASDTPIWEAIIPGPAAGGGAGFVEDFPMGLSFALGIAQVVTLGYGDTDATAPAALNYILNFGYK